MAEKRKLINEMEKCFKKIDEGVEIFEETMGKMSEANSDNQRDKLQDDLKKEIKKLQRLREQIKGWQNSSDIKDKEKLNQYRRLIEQRMETFKDVERENKTKPHSKQGLSAEDKMDPREKEKFETLEWLNTQIRKIQEEIDRTESKIESASTAETGKKKGKGKDNKNAEKEKIEEMKKHLDKVQFHLQNLEVCMRMITNEKLDIKDVLTKLKEPLDMYIEALDPESDEDPSNYEPDDIYEELGLGDYISQLGATVFHSLDDDKGPKSQSNSPTHDDASKARQISGDFQKTTRSKSITSNSTAPQTPATPSSAGIHVKMTRQTSGDNSSSISSPPPQTPPPAIRTKVALQNSVPHAGTISSPIVTRPTVTAVVSTPHAQPSYASAAAQSQQRVVSAQAAPGVTPLTMPTMPGQNIAQVVSNQPAVGTPVESLISAQSASLASPLSGSINSLVTANAKSLSYATVAAGSNMTPPPTSSDSTTKQSEGKIEDKPVTEQEMNPKGLNDVLMSSELVRGFIRIDDSNVPKTPQSTTIQPWLGGNPLGEIRPTEDMQNSLRMFEAVASRAPAADDSGKIRPVMPKTPCQTAPYYPQKVQPNFETLDYYTRLQPETLFFTFYFMEGTKAQLLAAKALKKLAWRYHTKYLTWFQRHEEPKQITDDFEMGTYIFFDFEKWARRKRENFTFEYKFLEDKDVD